MVNEDHLPFTIAVHSAASFQMFGFSCRDQSHAVRRLCSLEALWWRATFSRIPLMQRRRSSQQEPNTVQYLIALISSSLLSCMWKAGVLYYLLEHIQGSSTQRKGLLVHGSLMHDRSTRRRAAWMEQNLNMFRRFSPFWKVKRFVMLLSFWSASSIKKSI